MRQDEAGPRWPAALGRHPLLLDAGLAVLLWAFATTAITTTAEVTSPLGNGLGALANLALVAPLVWRRRAPLLTLAAVLVLALVVVATVGATGGELALLVALATAVAASPSWPAAAVPAGLATVGVPVLAAVAGGVRSREELVAAGAALVAAVAVGAAGRLARERRTVLAERAAERAADRARAEARRTDEAIAAERARIARELHDVVAHQVTVMVSLADGAQVAVARSPDRARAVMAQVSATGREALGELRGLLGVLSADGGPGDGPGAGSAPQPGVGQIGELVQRVRDAGLAATLHVEGSPQELDPVAQLTLFRVTQEALTNALRHAHAASRVDVHLRRDAAGVGLEVVDDGTAAPAAGVGRGLVGMRQRAALHAGELTAGPAGNRGWRVALHLPADTPAGVAS